MDSLAEGNLGARRVAELGVSSKEPSSHLSLPPAFSPPVDNS